MHSRIFASVLTLITLFPALAFSEIKPLRGPLVAKVGNIAEVYVPEGFSFVEKKDCKEFMEITHNTYSGDELGVMINDAEDARFLIFFEFDEIGYIKDAASEKLDADKMWTSMQGSTVRSNKARSKKGWPAIDLVRWEKKPEFNVQTNRLEWAYWLSSENEEFINFNTRMLGRRGVMRVTLVPNSDTLAADINHFNAIMQKFEFQTGNKYAEWVQGDKIAAIGLTALVAGGAGALAVKSGLFAKLWKFIVIGLVAIAGFFKKIWNAITGKKDVQQP
jgi:uncharacterized membrane-anchored protein